MISFGSILGFVFLFALLTYWTLAFLVLYHLIRFGVSGQPKKIAFFFIAGSIVLTIITALLFAQVPFDSIEGGGTFMDFFSHTITPTANN